MIAKLKNMIFVLWEDFLRNLNLMKIATHFCRGCNKRLSSIFLKCPYCGSSSRRIEMSLVDSVGIVDSLFHARLKSIGFKKFAVDLVHRYKSSGDRRLKEGVYEERFIDKIKDLHKQFVYKIVNGKIGVLLHKDVGKISEHKH